LAAAPAWADDQKPAGSPTAASPGAPAASPAGSSLQREYARLAQLLNSDDTFGKQEAASTFLRVRPSDVANPDTRKLIARGYRSLALDGRGGSQDDAIRGLVIWGGKHSVPVLVELMENEKLGISDEIFTALGNLKDPRGAEAVARSLGNFFNHDKAVSSLRKMGSAAEDVLIKAAPSSDPKVSLAAVLLLGDVGSEKSLVSLQKASSSKNREIKMAAREAIKRIRQRQRTGESVDKPDVVDPDSPFAEGAGPAVDITARNARDAGRGLGAGRPPATRGAADDGAGAGIGDDEVEEPEVVLDEGDWSNVNALLPGDPAGAGVPLDPPSGGVDATWRAQPTRLGKAASAQEAPSSIAIAAGAPIAVVIHGDPWSKSIGRMEMVNLKQRRSLGSTNILGGAAWSALSPQATRALVVGKEEGHDGKARLSLWSIDGGKASEVVTWWPYATSDMWDNRIAWAEWLDEERFLTLNADGMLVLWKLNDNKPSAVYQIDASANSEPALSPGRKHLALATPRGIEIFRADDGDILARMGEVRPSAGRLAFSTNGGQLACVTGESVYIWNAQDGKLQRDFDCRELNGGSLTWLDPMHLLVGGKDVVNLPKRVIAWRYEGAHGSSAPYGGYQWQLLKSGNVVGVVPQKLLKPEVLAATDGLNQNEILALKPGAKVALDLQLGGEEQTKAEAAMRKELQRIGAVEAPDSPLRLTARIVTGRSETQEYGRSRFVDFGDREQVTVTEKLYEVELTIDGQTVWKKSSVLQSGSSPMTVWMEKGESAQQAVDRQNESRAANFAYGVSLPRYIVHPKFAGPLGTSTISLGGG
jgi:hypothetical protein